MSATIIIEPGVGTATYWRDLWQFRELLYFLAWRDLAVRYKQTVIGIAWAVLKPALTMLVFVAFRRMVGLPREGGVPEAILVLSAVLPWQFFSAAVSESSGSLIGNAHLISKIYFPRLLIPSAAVLTSFVDFAITLGMLALVMAWYEFAPGWQLAVLPVFALLTMCLAMGLGLLFAALTVEYRDFRYVVPFIVQFGLFVSPIAFTTTTVPEAWRALFELNPLVGIIDGFRWSIVGGRTPLESRELWLCGVITLGILWLGAWYFRRVERSFADLI